MHGFLTPPITPVHCSERRTWARGVVEIHVRGKNLLEVGLCEVDGDFYECERDGRRGPQDRHFA